MLDIQLRRLATEDGREVLTGFNHQLVAGKPLVVMGPSGSGKSTLLDWITGAQFRRLQSEGDLLIDGRSVLDLPTENRRIGLLPQNARLFPHMTVEKNLRIAFNEADKRKKSRAEKNELIDCALYDVGLLGMKKRMPNTLSGGQNARACLVRTLLSKPKVLLLDEPFSSLDTNLRADIRELVWRQAAHLPILLVTHDTQDIPDSGLVFNMPCAEA